MHWEQERIYPRDASAHNLAYPGRLEPGGKEYFESRSFCPKACAGDMMKKEL